MIIITVVINAKIIISPQLETIVIKIITVIITNMFY